MEKLATESQKLGAALYQQQGAEGGAAGGAPGGAGAQDAGKEAGSDDVVDAEIVDEDDKK
jgi:molecular chaperone DnaK